MPEKTQPHPADDVLIAFGLGQLQPAKATEIETHLERCPKCCETLLDLQDDTFVGLLRKSSAPPATEAGGPVAEGRSQAGPERGSEELQDREGQSGGDAACATVLGISPDLGIPPALLEHPRYRVVELIGRGGMGDVYKAEHRFMNRTVALKVIRPELVANAQAATRFRREVQAAAKLAHPNIVAAYDAETAGGLHYLVMEYVDGTDLAELVRRRGPLDLSEACQYIQQAAEGLQHAMEHGMVHRDIKPQNLMVTTGGQIKILDFGLASLASRRLETTGSPGESGGAAERSPALTGAGMAMGTPDFISPEQARDARSADIRSDIYSLGCTLYYLLTGNPPFNEGAAADRIRAHAERDPEPIERIRKDLPDELPRLLLRMMAKDPAARFQTPAEVAAALSPLVADGNSPAALREAPAEPALHRNSAGGLGKRLLLAAAAGAAVLMVAAAVLYVLTDRGTLRIESIDESVRIRVLKSTGDGRQVQLEVIDTVTGSRVLRLPSGDYRLSLENPESGFELSREGFVLSRGEETVVRVTRDERPPAAVETQPAATPETSAELRELVTAAREATGADEWKTVAAAYAPVLALLLQDDARGAIELLTELPEEMHESLLQRGYLKWKADSLDAHRQEVIGEILGALLSRAPNASPDLHDESAIEARLAQSDVGFAVVELPDIDEQAVVWYLLDRKHAFPVILAMTGGTTVTRPAMLKPVGQQVKSLLEEPYSVLPPAHVALPSTAEALERFTSGISKTMTDDGWRTLLGDYAAPLVEMPADFRRDLFRFVEGVPADAWDVLLHRGYLKWRFRALDPLQQEALQTLYRWILTQGGKLSEDKIDLLTRMLAAADVGFAIVESPGALPQTMVIYLSIPNFRSPIVLPILGSASVLDDEGSRKSAHERIRKLEDESYSELPEERLREAD